MDRHPTDNRLAQLNNLERIADYTLDLDYEGAIIEGALPETLRTNLWKAVANRPKGQTYFLGSISKGQFTAKQNFAPLNGVEGLTPFIIAVANAMHDERVDTLSFGIFVNIARSFEVKKRFELGKCLHSLGTVSHTMISFSEYAGALEWVIPKKLTRQDMSDILAENPAYGQTRYFEGCIGQTGPNDLLVMRSHCNGRSDFINHGVRRRVQLPDKDGMNITMMWLPRTPK